MKKISLNEDSYIIRKMSEKDVAALQDLCERCYEFTLLTEGQMPGENAGYDIMNDLPPGKELKDKKVLGVYDEELLVAVVEMIKDYKVPGEWIIGLMMIDPVRRGNYLGSLIHNYIREFVALNGGSLLRIGVIEQNVKGLNFWKKLGYMEVERKEQNFGKKDHIVIVMNSKI